MYKNFEIITLNKSKITDFALERNRLLDEAKKKWVFFVDSDEKFSPSLLKELENIIESTSYSGFYVLRKNYFLGKYVGTDKIIRIVKKGSGIWTRAVHEIFIPYHTHPPGVQKIGLLKNYLIHNTADNLFKYINKINFYSTLHSKENIKEGKRSGLSKIIFYPIGKFIITFIKSKNIVFSILQSFHSFLAWSEIWLLKK